MDTIVAISSPPGAGAIGVVRLSGPDSHRIGLRLSGLTSSCIDYRYVYHAVLRDEDGNPIDDATIVFYRSPGSYTGEDMVEVFCHSGQAVLSAIIDYCLRAGARPAEPGEFTMRAFRNGKMDLAQVEAVADIIEAGSRISLQAALNVREGKLSSLINEIRERLMFLISETEADIDFEEEELLEKAPVSERIKILDELVKRLEILVENGKLGVRVKEGIRVALAGPPNAGKSSLMNAFARRERSIVTPEPGTTRDIIEERVLMKGLPAVLIDTAGLREAESIAEEEGVRRAKQAIREADIVLAVVDGTQAPDEKVLEALRQLPLDKTMILLNKLDLGLKVSKDDMLSLIQQVSGNKINQITDISGDEMKNNIGEEPGRNAPPHPVEVYEVSAKTGAGLDRVTERMVDRVFSQGVPPAEDILVANRRHLFHLENALRSLEEARNKLCEKEGEGSVEISAFLLREASYELAKIIGLVTTDEILSEIFSRFCIGK